MFLDELLQERRSLIEIIAQAADSVSRVDAKIAIAKSQELEIDLIQAAERAKT